MDFLRVKNSTETSADLFIYGDIVGNYDQKWSDSDTAPEDIKRVLDEIDGKDLNIYINSGGGSVFGGLAIYNMLKRSKGFKTVHIDGLAGSIASIIAFAGDKIVIPSNSFLMIHRAWTIGQGNSNDFRKLADDLERIDEGILNVYKENLRDGVALETIKEMVDQETWLTGEQAKQFFNVETTDSLEMVACTSDFFKNYKEVPNELVKNEKEETKNELKANITVNVDETMLKKVIEDVSNELKEKAKTNETKENEDLLLMIDLI